MRLRKKSATAPQEDKHENEKRKSRVPHKNGSSSVPVKEKTEKKKIEKMNLRSKSQNGSTSKTQTGSEVRSDVPTANSDVEQPQASGSGVRTSVSLDVMKIEPPSPPHHFEDNEFSLPPGDPGENIFPRSIATLKAEPTDQPARVRVLPPIERMTTRKMSLTIIKTDADLPPPPSTRRSIRFVSKAEQGPELVPSPAFSLHKGTKKVELKPNVKVKSPPSSSSARPSTSTVPATVAATVARSDLLALRKTRKSVAVAGGGLSESAPLNIQPSLPPGGGTFPVEREKSLTNNPQRFQIMNEEMSRAVSTVFGKAVRVRSSQLQSDSSSNFIAAKRSSLRLTTTSKTAADKTEQSTIKAKKVKLDIPPPADADVAEPPSSSLTLRRSVREKPVSDVDSRPSTSIRPSFKTATVAAVIKRDKPSVKQYVPRPSRSRSVKIEIKSKRQSSPSETVENHETEIKAKDAEAEGTHETETNGGDSGAVEYQETGSEGEVEEDQMLILNHDQSWRATGTVEEEIVVPSSSERQENGNGTAADVGEDDEISVLYHRDVIAEPFGTADMEEEVEVSPPSDDREEHQENEINEEVEGEEVALPDMNMKIERVSPISELVQCQENETNGEVEEDDDDELSVLFQKDVNMEIESSDGVNVEKESPPTPPEEEEEQKDTNGEASKEEEEEVATVLDRNVEPSLKDGSVCPPSEFEKVHGESAEDEDEEPTALLKYQLVTAKTVNRISKIESNSSTSHLEEGLEENEDDVSTETSSTDEAEVIADEQPPPENQEQAIEAEVQKDEEPEPDERLSPEIQEQGIEAEVQKDEEPEPAEEPKPPSAMEEEPPPPPPEAIEMEEVEDQIIYLTKEEEKSYFENEARVFRKVVEDEEQIYRSTTTTTQENPPETVAGTGSNTKRTRISIRKAIKTIRKPLKPKPMMKPLRKFKRKISAPAPAKPKDAPVPLPAPEPVNGVPMPPLNGEEEHDEDGYCIPHYTNEEKKRLYGDKQFVVDVKDVNGDLSKMCIWQILESQMCLRKYSPINFLHQQFHYSSPQRWFFFEEDFRSEEFYKRFQPIVAHVAKTEVFFAQGWEMEECSVQLPYGDRNDFYWMTKNIGQIYKTEYLRQDLMKSMPLMILQIFNKVVIEHLLVHVERNPEILEASLISYTQAWNVIRPAIDQVLAEAESSKNFPFNEATIKLLKAFPGMRYAPTQATTKTCSVCCSTHQRKPTVKVFFLAKTVCGPQPYNPRTLVQLPEPEVPIPHQAVYWCEECAKAAKIYHKLAHFLYTLSRIVRQNAVKDLATLKPNGVKVTDKFLLWAHDIDVNWRYTQFLHLQLSIAEVQSEFSNK